MLSRTANRPDDLPRVTIVILNWNTFAVTRDCLMSLDQVDYPNRATLLVDNGSSDGSPDKLAAQFAEVTIIRNNSNLGFAAGNNVGIRCALQRGTDYVLLLNNDTVVSPSFLSSMVAVAERDPRIGVLSPLIYYFEPSDRIWYAGGSFAKWRGVAFHQGQGSHLSARYKTTREVTFVTGCALLIRSTVIAQVGLLDETFFMVCEDTDWSIRVLRSGYKAVYVPDAVIWHKESSTIKTQTGKWLRDYYNIRNSVLVARKHCRYYHWPSIVLFLIGTLLWRTGGYCIFGQFVRIRALYRGLYHGLTGRLGKPARTAESS